MIQFNGGNKQQRGPSPRLLSWTRSALHEAGARIVLDFSGRCDAYASSSKLYWRYEASQNTHQEKKSSGNGCNTALGYR